MNALAIRRALRPGPQREKLTAALAQRLLTGEGVQPCAPLPREVWAEAELFCRAVEREGYPHMVVALVGVLGDRLAPVVAAVAGYRREDVQNWRGRVRVCGVYGVTLAVGRTGVTVCWPGTRLMMRWAV